MLLRRTLGLLVGACILGVAWCGSLGCRPAPSVENRDERVEVIFWHFWGGQYREVVESIVERFNRQQTEFRVRAIAMPGNNFTAKLFLAIAGGDPPDLINQDDPIIGDWAARGAILPWDQLVTESEGRQLQNNLLPAAKKLGTFQGRLYGVCNGLDIRALYYNKTILDEYQLPVPTTMAELDQIARTIRPPMEEGGMVSTPKYFGYLPDARRLWAWGYAFGGDFYDEASGQVTVASEPIERAASWMRQYAHWYGEDTINAFRQGDQSLPGKSFPLLPIDQHSMVGRYVVLMDGQWRAQDIKRFLQHRAAEKIPSPQFGVCPLPVVEASGRTQAGWVNGNFFVVPKGCQQKRGAVAFMKFWIGLEQPDQAAQICVDGGWIPVTQSVMNHQTFQEHLAENPLFASFVALAESEHQYPIPVIPGAPFFKRTVEQTGAKVMSEMNTPVQALLQQATKTIQKRLDESKNTFESLGANAD